MCILEECEFSYLSMDMLKTSWKTSDAHIIKYLKQKPFHHHQIRTSFSSTCDPKTCQHSYPSSAMPTACQQLTPDSHMFLQERVPAAGNLILEPDVGQGLIFGSCQLVLLLLHQFDPVQLLGPLLVQLLHSLAQKLDRLLTTDGRSYGDGTEFGRRHRVKRIT